MNKVKDDGGAFTVSLLKSNEKKTCSDLIEALDNDVSLLRTESRHGSRISNELDSKLEWFTHASATLSGKLESLWSLSRMRNDYDDDNNINEVKEFADKISNSWKLANKQVYEEYARIRVASRTLSGTPLTTLLLKIRKRTNAVKASLKIGEDIYDKGSISKGLLIYDEITTLLKKLERCDEKVQQYLLICKMTPYLIELESAVDAYVASNELLPGRGGRNNSELSVLPILVDLLTGKLLGQEPINPNHVLVANAPRKPVFITKNVGKRKMDIPALPGIRMSKSSNFLSSFR